MKMKSDRILFDFRIATAVPGWEVVNVEVMGGVSTSEFQLLPRDGAVFRGTVRLENNGGFASVRSSPMREDLRECTAFVLRVRGDGRHYKFTVRTDPGFDTPLYQRGFGTQDGDWEEHRLAFSDFISTFRGRVLTDVPPLNPATVCCIGILISEKQAGPFRLEIERIKAISRGAVQNAGA